MLEGDLAARQWIATVETFVDVARYPPELVQSWRCPGAGAPIARGATATCVCGLAFSVAAAGMIPPHAKSVEQLKERER